MTKILATIGPASESTLNLKRILKFTNLIRLNGAHNNIEWHEKISKKIKKINPNTKILLDLPGIKPRSQNKEDIVIKKNEILFFSFVNIKKKKYKIIKISKPLPKTNNSKYLTISDGKYKLRILKKWKNFVKVKSLESFYLKPGKGINIPLSIYSDKYQKKVFFEFLKKAKKIKYDCLGLSFVQNETIIKSLKKLAPNKLIVSKIENTQGCSNLEKIISHSDLIMIDRGDLSAEIGDTNLFRMIEKISQKTKEKGKPLIMATENLETMINNSSPSKSEIVSLGFSLKLFSDVIMLSDETATSKNFYRILNWLKDFLKNNNYDNMKISKNLKTKFDLWDLIQSINHEKTNLVIFTRKGYAINKILTIKPNIKIFVFSDNYKVLNTSEFISNCYCKITSKFPTNMDSFIFKTIKRNKKIIFSNRNDTLLIYVAFPRAKSRANTISNISIKDF